MNYFKNGFLKYTYRKKLLFYLWKSFDNNNNTMNCYGLNAVHKVLCSLSTWFQSVDLDEIIPNLTSLAAPIYMREKSHFRKIAREAGVYFPIDYLPCKNKVFKFAGFGLYLSISKRRQFMSRLMLSIPFH